jgi:hypothetical protein
MELFGQNKTVLGQEGSWGKAIKPVHDRSYDWPELGRNLQRRFSGAQIELFPESGSPTIEEIELAFPRANRIFVADFYLKGIEKTGALLPCGAGYGHGGKVINIDHHAPDEIWERHVSSGVLACKWVREEGVVSATNGDIVVINHTDCDSVLSALILTGVIPAHERFEQAVLDADHRGTPNEIADILQACKSLRKLRLMVEALSCYFQDYALPEVVRKQLEELHESRLAVKLLVERGEFQEQDGVVLINSNRYFESDLFLSHFPDARVLVVGCPSGKNPHITFTRLRLGAGVEQGLSLHRLGVKESDPYFGGRFNAGSNKRGLEAAVDKGQNPTVVSPEQYFKLLVEKLALPHKAVLG